MRLWRWIKKHGWYLLVFEIGFTLGGLWCALVESLLPW